jgi:hypothetical protein
MKLDFFGMNNRLKIIGRQTCEVMEEMIDHLPNIEPTDLGNSRTHIWS